MRRIAVITGLVGSLMANTASADVWEFRRDGSSVFHQTLDYMQRNRLSGNWRPPTPAALRARRAIYDPAVQTIAAERGIDPLLVHAMIEVESAYDPFAVSKAGAIGMMQLMPETAARFGVVDSRDAEANILGGARYIEFLSELFPGEPELIIAAYHAGENRVAPCLQKIAGVEFVNCERRAARIPNIPETQRHVELVMAAYGRRVQASKTSSVAPVANVTDSAGGND